MHAISDHLLVIRSNLIEATDSLSLTQLTTVPQGFNNNILWNVGHVVTTQQVLIYKLSDQPMALEPAFVERYRKGSTPSVDYPYEEDWAIINELLLPLVEKMRNDLSSDIFQTFQEYQTSFGVKLHTAREAANFNNLHESLHLGYIMSMKHNL